MSSTKYRIRRVGLGSLGKFGCLLGALVSVVPSLVVGLGALAAVSGLRRLLEGWQQAQIRVLGQAFPVDVVALLNLDSLLQRAQVLDALSWTLVAATVVVGCLLGGVLFLVVGHFAGSIYNVVARLSGGLEVELREVPGGSRAGHER